MIKKKSNRSTTAQVSLVILGLLLAGIWFLYEQFYQSSQSANLSTGKLNISWFVFRDVNRNGIYDIEDRPYSGIRILLKRPDGSSVFATSNTNGFANFKMSTNPKLGVIASEGKYKLVAKLPDDWEITSGTNTVDLEFRYLEHSPAGIVASTVTDPLGVAPIPKISGNIDEVRGNYSIHAVTPSGEKLSVKIGEDGSFRLTGNPGVWSITRKNNTTGAEQSKYITLKYYPVVLSRSFLDLPDSIQRQPNPTRYNTTVTYDDLTSSGSVYEIPNGYEGLNWKNWIATHRLFYKGSGYVNAAISSEYVAYNSSGHPGIISSNKPFDFVGTYIGVAWPKASKGLVHIEGYRDEKLVYNDSLRLDNRIPVHFYANYRDITSLKIYSDLYWQVILENSQFHISR